MALVGIAISSRSLVRLHARSTLALMTRILGFPKIALHARSPP